MLLPLHWSWQVRSRSPTQYADLTHRLVQLEPRLWVPLVELFHSDVEFGLSYSAIIVISNSVELLASRHSICWRGAYSGCGGPVLVSVVAAAVMALVILADSTLI